MSKGKILTTLVAVSVLVFASAVTRAAARWGGGWRGGGWREPDIAAGIGAWGLSARRQRTGSYNLPTPLMVPTATGMGTPLMVPTATGLVTPLIVGTVTATVIVSATLPRPIADGPYRSLLRLLRDCDACERSDRTGDAAAGPLSSRDRDHAGCGCGARLNDVRSSGRSSSRQEIVPRRGILAPLEG